MIWSTQSHEGINAFALGPSTKMIRDTLLPPPSTSSPALTRVHKRYTNMRLHHRIVDYTTSHSFPAIVDAAHTSTSHVNHSLIRLLLCLSAERLHWITTQMCWWSTGDCSTQMRLFTEVTDRHCTNTTQWLCHLSCSYGVSCGSVKANTQTPTIDKPE